MDPAFAALLNQLSAIFSGVDFGLVVQRAIVGATLLTVGWFSYRYFVRPPGSLYWLRAEAHRLTAGNHRLAAQVARDEGFVDGLKTHLALIVNEGRPTRDAPPDLIHPLPPDGARTTA